MKKILLWAVPLSYLFLANTTIRTMTELSALDSYIMYKIGLALLLLTGVILTRTSKEVGISLSMNVRLIKQLWLFGLFACVQISVYGFNVNATIFTKYLVLALAIGVIEELVFRGILFNLLKNKTQIKIVLISASAFASIHLLNLLSGMSPVFVGLQIFAALSIGLMLGVVRIKDTSIWIVVIAHALINFATFVSVGLENPKLNTTEVLMWLVPSIAFFIHGIIGLKGLMKANTNL